MCIRDSRYSERQPEVAQRQLQAAEVRMVVVADGEGDVERVARQKRRLLQAFGHVPAKGVENGSQFSALDWRSETADQVKDCLLYTSS